jgi:homogentisate 1,2-dioxygenase
VRQIQTLVLAALACTAAACGGVEEAMTEAAIEAASGQQVDVAKDGEQMTFKTEQGEMTISGGESATLPKAFPKDVYLPAGYKVMSAMDMPGAMIVELAAPGAVASTSEAADKAMLAQGWKQTMSMQQTAENRVLTYEKADRAAVVSVYDNEGKGVKVGVQVTSKQ